MNIVLHYLPLNHFIASGSGSCLKEVSNVELSIKGGLGGFFSTCGGEGVYIKLEKSDGTFCETAEKGGFDTGDTLRWSGSQLNTCRIVKEFDFYRNEIQFEVRSTDSGKYCPTALTIQLDSGPEYRKSFNGNCVNSLTGSASREADFNPGKIF